MNFETYTERARAIIQAAQGYALNRKHQHFTPEHLLKALLDDNGGLAKNLIQAAGGRSDAVKELTETALQKLPKVEGGNGQLYLAPKTA